MKDKAAVGRVKPLILDRIRAQVTPECPPIKLEKGAKRE
jgi:hypothetical protein